MPWRCPVFLPLEHVDAGSAARRATFFTPHGAGRNAGLHARGHPGQRQGAGIEQLRRPGAADGAGQHLSPGPAARRRGGRATWAACTASWAGTARSSPIAAAFNSSASPNQQSDRRAGRLPLAYRRPAAGDLAGAGRGHPGGAGERRGHGLGPRGRAAQPAGGRSATRPSGASAGPPAAAQAARRRTRPSSPSCRRAGRGVAGLVRRRIAADWISPATPWAA